MTPDRFDYITEIRWIVHQAYAGRSRPLYEYLNDLHIPPSIMELEQRGWPDKYGKVGKRWGVRTPPGLAQ